MQLLFFCTCSLKGDSWHHSRHLKEIIISIRREFPKCPSVSYLRHLILTRRQAVLIPIIQIRKLRHREWVTCWRIQGSLLPCEPSASQVPKAAREGEAGSGSESQRHTEARRQRCQQTFRARYQGAREMSPSLLSLITYPISIMLYKNIRLITYLVKALYNPRSTFARPTNSSSPKSFEIHKAGISITDYEANSFREVM